MLGALCYASSTGKVYLWGCGGDRNLWSWDGTWTNLGAGGPASEVSRLAYDSTHDRVIIWQPYASVYQYNPGAGTWAGPYTGGTPPANGYYSCQMAYYPEIDKCVSLASDATFTYLYDQPTHSWSRLAVRAGGANRNYGGMFYDALRKTVVEVAGRNPGAQDRQCWSFNGSLWTRVNDLAGVANYDKASCCWASAYNMGLLGAGDMSTAAPLVAQEGTW
jgi:hypothetical protein